MLSLRRLNDSNSALASHFSRPLEPDRHFHFADFTTAKRRLNRGEIFPNRILDVLKGLFFCLPV